MLKMMILTKIKDVALIDTHSTMEYLGRGMNDDATYFCILHG